MLTLRGFCVLLSLLMAATVSAQTSRVKDIASVQGVRSNQLVGYGLVVGLDGTGDQTTQTPFTVQSLTAMLTQLGVNVPAGTRLQLKNVAAVMVTANLPAFAQAGQALDVTVSSLGNAKSLRGGTLLMTPLKGADGQIYAIAQGNLHVGGVGVQSSGSSRQVNHLAAGRIPGGATVERTVESPFADSSTLRLELSTGDFSTARSVVDAINRQLGPDTARAIDARVVELAAPVEPSARVAFMAQVESVELMPAAAPARIVVNARSGSVVMNQAVRLNPVAVAHGNLTVTVNATPQVVQPNALAQGQTVATQQADVAISESGTNLVFLNGGAQLADVVKALNTLGASPQDLISILQALKAAGSLTAELEII